MAEPKSVRGGSLLANPSALLALVTVAGGLWLVSQKLTSDRPVTPAGGSKESVGDQELEARLWEDPFKYVTNGDRKGSADGSSDTAVDLNALAEQIRRRSDSNRPGKPGNAAKAANAAEGVLLLPVMLAGGQYSEDQESRIRSRFAVVSALGRSGYVPEDAEHIGELRVPWLTQQEMDDAKQGTSDQYADNTQLWAEEQQSAPSPQPDPGKKPGPKIRLLGIEPSGKSVHMEVRFEWYRPRSFGAGADFRNFRSGVLVLWLDDSYFEDDPLLRLSLLLERLTDPLRMGPLPPDVALIGPRRSSTLRSMLPNWQTGQAPLLAIPNRSLEPLARKVFNRIDVFCATPSAMDEVLVRNPKDPDNKPRWSVGESLKGEGFRSFHNFAATDAQMAHEVLAELALRGADLNEDKNHVVLISEWDTFYARMLSLTYGAELAVWKKTQLSRAAFVHSFTSLPEDRNRMPANFHSLVYLRGLDGQTVGGEGSAREAGADYGRSGRALPSSIEELRHWAPDVNKAEGQAQFDYLGRLGDRMDELQKYLHRRDGGEIKAIGIVGSDVYDTLLILQALRQRFPDALFFTTDLDVRFFHPRERDWARNLIVASAYGLTLHRDLQKTIAPFRDSTQTAQFAAVLAALGNRDLAGAVTIPPRRFEIGNRTAVDLSVIKGGLSTTEPQTKPPHRRSLHPATVSEVGQTRRLNNFFRLGCSVAAVVLMLAGTCWLWIPLRCLTWRALDHLAKALDYAEEDIGGPDGAEALLRRLERNAGDEIGQWLLAPPKIRELRAELKAAKGKGAKPRPGEPASVRLKEKPADSPDDLNWEQEKILAKQTEVLVKRLNQLLRQEPLPAEETMPVIQFDSDQQPGWLGAALWRWPQARRVIKRHAARRRLNDYLYLLAFRQHVDESRRAEADRRRIAGIRKYLRQGLAGASRTLSWMLDKVFGGLRSPRVAIDDGLEPFEKAALLAAVGARESAEGIFQLRCRQLIGFWMSVVGFGLLALGLGWAIWYDRFKHADGEPFSLTNGTSAWPTEILRLLVLALAVCFGFGLSHKMREAFFNLTRGFRLATPLTRASGPVDPECAQSIWDEYREGSCFRRRLKRIGFVIVLYGALLVSISLAFGESVFRPVRGPVASLCDYVLLGGSVLGFLLLAFLTVDAAVLCREFIEKLSAGPTLYPEATRRHFSREKGRIAVEYLDEWIDLELIAELTEQVGRLVYYPAGLLLLLFLARNSWWDCWSWPVSLIVIFAFNFILALASVTILQQAAKEAKSKAEKTLTAKVKKLQAEAAPSVVQNNASQAERLLEEIRQLDRGAFVPFWENPVVGAVFLSSGGTTMLQVFIWFMGR